jgi:hypothetical protein
VGIVFLLSVLGGTTFVGRSALELVTTGSSPAEESVLAQGYVDFFNQPATQDLLRGQTGVPASVTLSARVAVASPIFYIEATASQPQLATSAASKVGTAFRDEVEHSLERSWPAEAPPPGSRGGKSADTTLTILCSQCGTDTVRPDPTRSMATYGVLAALVGAGVAAAIPERGPTRARARA